jgi:hypothetical protein
MYNTSIGSLITAKDGVFDFDHAQCCKALLWIRIRIRISIKVICWIRIRINVTWTIRIRTRIKMKGRIWIRNNGKMCLHILVEKMSAISQISW